MIADCTAIILAGGDSRRMGQDKAMLSFKQQPLIQSVIATMQPLFAATIVSVREPRPEIHLPQVLDHDSNGGPLVALIASLAAMQTNWAFVVGCDMPFVSPALVEKLALKRATQHAVIAVVAGHLQPLAGFYSRRSLVLLRAHLALGQKSLVGALKGMMVSYVDEGELLKSDPLLRSFFDLDTPQDLLVAQGMD